ncbi:MAG: HipA N-terminal domain-containing protein [Sphaerochaetaceae bacterium]
MTLLREAVVQYDGQEAGILQETDEGYVFTYSIGYVQNPESKPISLTMGLREESYHSNTLFPFFDGLIPEGWLLEVVCANWKLDRRDRMGLLMTACKDCIGAVSVHGKVAG